MCGDVAITAKVSHTVPVYIYMHINLIYNYYRYNQ